jgi:hypothetical protein
MGFSCHAAYLGFLHVMFFSYNLTPYCCMSLFFAKDYVLISSVEMCLEKLGPRTGVLPAL